MPAKTRKNDELEKTTAELVQTHKELEGRRLPYDSRRKLIMVDPHITTGLWPRCERLTFQAFTEIRCKREWQSVDKLCIRTPKTKLLHDLLKRRFGSKKKKKKA